jgi:DASH complex subunit DAD4
MLNKNLQEINIQNMDTELVAQMFKNYQSNVLFHLEGTIAAKSRSCVVIANPYSYQRSERPGVSVSYRLFWLHRYHVERRA